MKPLASDEQRCEIARESIPEVEPELTLPERVQRVQYSSSPWMDLIVNGVGRYLPTQDVVEVPAFMDTPKGAAVTVEKAAGGNADSRAAGQPNRLVVGNVETAKLPGPPPISVPLASNSIGGCGPTLG